ncbi:MAG: hypothetical protein DLM57_17015 [Pseudonocardiales bacterium]|nr:MAG: hypothetical protein DLM57_17015 [Pseudonocardiales bacterium]
MLADSREVCERVSGAGPSDGDASPSPWLPSDDLISRLPPAAPLAAPETFEASASRPVARAHRSSGLVERLSARLVIRADPGRRGAIAVGVAVLVAAVVTGAWVLSSRPHALAVGSTGADPAAVAAARSAAAAGTSLTPEPTRDPASASAARGSAAPTLVVDVAGKVRHPGLYRLPAGSRVADAVQAAGGALPGVDLTALNLAAKIADGQQITVGMTAVAPGAGGPGPGVSPSQVAAPVDLNSATLAQLETLPGVGPVLGQHILDWRAAHGQFSTIDQLRDVIGIGDIKFAALRSQVTV